MHEVENVMQQLNTDGPVAASSSTSRMPIRKKLDGRASGNHGYFDDDTLPVLHTLAKASRHATPITRRYRDRPGRADGLGRSAAFPSQSSALNARGLGANDRRGWKAVIYQWESGKRTPSAVLWAKIEDVQAHAGDRVR